jgi:predicted transcriptional regulator
MSTPKIHPKAYLSKKRNVKAGLRARSKILFILEEGKRGASDISKPSGLTYECIAYHLRSMSKERLIERSRQRPYIWTLTAFGQQKLES